MFDRAGLRSAPFRESLLRSIWASIGGSESLASPKVALARFRFQHRGCQWHKHDAMALKRLDPDANPLDRDRQRRSDADCGSAFFRQIFKLRERPVDFR